MVLNQAIWLATGVVIHCSSKYITVIIIVIYATGWRKKLKKKRWIPTIESLKWSKCNWICVMSYDLWYGAPTLLLLHCTVIQYA